MACLVLPIHTADNGSRPCVKIDTAVISVLHELMIMCLCLSGEHQSLPDVKLMLVGGEEFVRRKAGDYILQQTVSTEMIFKASFLKSMYAVA